MFPRSLMPFLLLWKNQTDRKPLVLRGARQTGKTTLVREFGKQFDIFIGLNLELSADRKLFEQELSIDSLVQAIFFQKNISRESGKSVLIFIDEIQNSPPAVAMLRYFFENCPDIHVIAAGSLLETLINTHISFPVGRVQYVFLYPFTFEEFLTASGEITAQAVLKETDPPDYAHEKMLELFHLYTMMGGMPEVVATWVRHHDWHKLSPVYESLLYGYQDDAEKYSKNSQQAQILRHVISQAPLHAAERIKFHHFGQSSYGSREVGEAMRLLEKTLLIRLVYPVTVYIPPFEPNQKKSPRLQFLDTGMINYSAGLQNEFFGLKDLNNLYRGKIIEHITGQELLSSEPGSKKQLLFWTQEKPDLTSELDYVLPQGTRFIPVEVKAGKTGTLRSLHTFMNLSKESTFAIRLYAGKLSREKIKTSSGKTWELLNLPYYLSGQLKRYL